MIPDGYTELAPGKIASVVTYLEMRTRPELPAPPPPPGLALRRAPAPGLAWYRGLYRLVGENWLWFSRLRLNDDALASILHNPLIEIYALSAQGADKGLLELDLRQFAATGDIEIASFGLASDLIGQGAGRFLMTEALRAAWAHNPTRVWLHTCTIDSPQALSFYRKSGFTPYRRAIEVSDDPRLTGDIPATAAPHLPIISG
jgi:GNAT superfamily N-acetyltransferase